MALQAGREPTWASRSELEPAVLAGVPRFAPGPRILVKEMDTARKEQIRFTAGVAALLYPSYRLFRFHPIFAVSIAAVPISEYVHNKVKMTPVLSRILSFSTFAGLIVLSWYFAEVIIVLAAIALVLEVQELVRLIREEYWKQLDEDLPHPEELGLRVPMLL